MAVPVRMVAGVCVGFCLADATFFWLTSWKLSRNPDDGCNFLFSQCAKCGAGAVREIAAEMMEESGDCRIAQAMGLIEFNVARDIKAAYGWLKKAREGEYRNKQYLLGLELYLSEFVDGRDRDGIIAQILSRNDLSASTTCYGLMQKAMSFLESGQWSGAEAIADRILTVEENYDARIVKWVSCFATGRNSEAKKHLLRVRAKVPESVLNITLAECWLFLGRVDRAMECLLKGDREMFRLSESRTQLGNLAKSEEFRQFCEGRQ